MIDYDLSIYYLFSWFRQDTHSFADDTQHHLVSPPSYGGKSHVPEQGCMKICLDGEDQCLPVHSADKNIVGEPHPPPELQAGVVHLPQQPPHLQLAHGGQLGHVPRAERVTTSVLTISLYPYSPPICLSVALYRQDLSISTSVASSASRK